MQTIKLRYTSRTGWPTGCFDRTAGCLADDSIERPPQGEYEERDSLL